MATRNTSIEVYRANIANPETLEPLRFWIQNELVKIQSGFVSADEVITNLAALIDELVESGGLQGEPGEKGATGSTGTSGSDGVDGTDGQDGQDATAADLIDDNRILHSKTWSSQMISSWAVERIRNQLLGEHQNVTLVNENHRDSLTYDSTLLQWIADARNRVHIQLTQPLDDESSVGDIWIVR